MPEGPAPQSGIVETASRRAIEGTPTGIAGIVGLTGCGPVAGATAVDNAGPRALHGYVEYERLYGGATPLSMADGTTRPACLAEAVYAFFDNGGSCIHVSRILRRPAGAGVDSGVASAGVFARSSLHRATWRARWPGSYGNAVIAVRFERSADLAFEHPAVDPLRSAWGVQLRDIADGALVEIRTALEAAPVAGEALLRDALAVVALRSNGRQVFRRGRRLVQLQRGDRVFRVGLALELRTRDGRELHFNGLGFEPQGASSLRARFAATTMQDCPLWLDEPAPGSRHRASTIALALALQDGSPFSLGGGHDGEAPTPGDLAAGAPSLDAQGRGGLAAFDELPEVELLLAPDAAIVAEDSLAMARELLAAVARRPHRFAIVDPPAGLSPQGVVGFRRGLDSARAALYWPWLCVDRAPTPGATLCLPPSGCMAGLYARVDAQRGVHKAPANEVLRGVVGFEAEVALATQDQLNSAGVCVLRFFAGRGHLAWGARTLSADPEWKYVPVRRLCSWLQHSLERALQWVVLEPNTPPTWSALRADAQEFLTRAWRLGMLAGASPQEALFVRCDAATMSAQDIAAGHLVCEVGVAPLRPAEFTSWRLAFQTAGAG